MQAIAEAAEGFSGSDLHQLCATAAAAPIMEMVRSGAATPRPLSADDLCAALEYLQVSASTLCIHWFIQG